MPPKPETLDIRDPKQRLQSYQDDWERTEDLIGPMTDPKELWSAIKLRLDLRKQVAGETDSEPPDPAPEELPRTIRVHRSEPE